MRGLDQQLATLAAMSATDLRVEWHRLFKAEPPRLPADLLRCGIGYRIQEKRRPGGCDAVHRALRRIAAGKPPAGLSLKSGTRLMRSWNGRSIAVLVTDDGFLFEDRVYRSLSAIAREVTGAHWSGPRFFGLTGHG